MSATSATNIGNAKNMTLEEKIVQTLKDETLYKMVGDEDAITELVKRAVSEALFQPERKTDQYGRPSVDKDSMVVNEARGVAKSAAEDAAKVMIGNLLENDEVKTVMLKAITDSLPAVMFGVLSQNLNMITTMSVDESVNRLRRELLDAGINVDFQ